MVCCSTNTNNVFSPFFFSPLSSSFLQSPSGKCVILSAALTAAGAPALTSASAAGRTVLARPAFPTVTLPSGKCSFFCSFCFFFFLDPLNRSSSQRKARAFILFPFQFSSVSFSVRNEALVALLSLCHLSSSARCFPSQLAVLLFLVCVCVSASEHCTL